MARGMSRRRASEIGFPLSALSSRASSSKFFSIRSASFRSIFERSAAAARDQSRKASREARTASSTSSRSLSGIAAITSSLAGLMSSRYLPLFGDANLPSMKLASRCKEFLRSEFPPIDIRIPRIPWHDRLHALAQIRRNRLGNDERFLAPQFVGIAELEAEDAEDVAGDVPGGLRVPAVGDFHHDAEAVRIFGMLDGQAKEAIGAFFGDHTAVTGLQDRRIQSVEAADEIRMRHHRIPNPVFILLSDQVGEEPREIGDGHADRRKSAAVFGDDSRFPLRAKDPANVGEVLLEKRMVRPHVTNARPSFELASAQQ